MLAVTRETVVGCPNAQRSVEAESKQGLRWKSDGSTASNCLADRSRSGASRRANCGAFAAAGDSSDNAPDQRSTAHVFTRSLVRAYTFFPFTGFGGDGLFLGIHNVPATVHVDGLKVDNDFGIVRVSGDELSVCSSWDHDAARTVEYVTVDYTRVDSAVGRMACIDSLIRPDYDFRPRRNPICLSRKAKPKAQSQCCRLYDVAHDVPPPTCSARDMPAGCNGRQTLLPVT
jgi:hypothetical protein